MNNHDTLLPLISAILSDEELPLTEGSSFQLLPPHVISNELYTVMNNFKSLYASIKAGNDYDGRAMASIINKLNKIHKEARTFSSEDEVPTAWKSSGRK
jgi:hypothetical protein